MPAARIASLAFVPASSALAREPSSASAGLRAELEDGKRSTFLVATPDQPALWTERDWFSFGAPVLFVRRLDRQTVADAAQAMAAEMGGYWLRYYNSADEPSPAARSLRRRRALALGAARVVSTAVAEAYPPRSPEHGCAVAQVCISDGREFSLLTATPSWFVRAFAELELDYCFGPAVLFVHRLESRLVRRAVVAMAAEGDRWLCRYDTPRRTLPEVLADFKARHPSARD